jgi:hypothetical protein
VRLLKNLSRRRWITGGLSYYDYQYAVGERVIVPWIREHVPIAGSDVADFGAHAGGVLNAFRAAGASSGVGYEINEEVVRASPFRSDDSFRLRAEDVTKLESSELSYELILLHDVLEHIPAVGTVLSAATKWLAPQGRIFVSFPPYYSMVGGHQHLARGVPRFIPWIHYLPERLFFRISQPMDNEYMTARDSHEDMVSVRRTRLTIGKAERAFTDAGLVVVASDHFLSRPEYTIRYGWPTIRVGSLQGIPIVREGIVNGAFYLLAKS